MRPWLVLNVSLSSSGHRKENLVSPALTCGHLCLHLGVIKPAYGEFRGSSQGLSGIVSSAIPYTPFSVCTTPSTPHLTLSLSQRKTGFSMAPILPLPLPPSQVTALSLSSFLRMWPIFHVRVIPAACVPTLPTTLWEGEKSPVCRPVVLFRHLRTSRS